MKMDHQVKQIKTDELGGRLITAASRAIWTAFMPVLALWAFAFAPMVALASIQTFTLEKGTFNMDVPEDWQQANDLFGIPLTLLGPMKDGSRPILSVTPTGQTVNFDTAALKKTEKEYQNGRKEWVKSKGGNVISFEPYKTEKWSGITVAHVVGYRYKISEGEFNEHSFYVVCKDGLYHLKTVIRSDSEKEMNSLLNKTVKSFKCE